MAPLDQEMEHNHLVGVGDRQLYPEGLRKRQIPEGVENMHTLEKVGDKQTLVELKEG